MGCLHDRKVSSRSEKKKRQQKTVLSATFRRVLLFRGLVIRVIGPYHLLVFLYCWCCWLAVLHEWLITCCGCQINVTPPNDWANSQCSQLFYIFSAEGTKAWVPNLITVRLVRCGSMPNPKHNEQWNTIDEGEEITFTGTTGDLGVTLNVMNRQDEKLLDALDPNSTADKTPRRAWVVSDASPRLQYLPLVVPPVRRSTI